MSKIIDFRKVGNVVRFFLGADDCDDYWGDDWNDRPYDCNAGEVYDEYVTGHHDIAFPLDYKVMEPCNDWHDANCHWCKEDMIKRRVPCIIAVDDEDCWGEEFGRWASGDNPKVKKFFFGDKMNSSEKMTVFCE